MLPQSVFNHLLYSDCRPGANCTIGNVGVDIVRKTHYRDSHWYVSFIAYLSREAILDKRVERFALADLVDVLPKMDYQSADWNEYVTGEC